MRLLEIDQRSSWDFVWDNTRLGFYVTRNGKEVPDTFHKANSIFDRSLSQDLAKKQMISLRAEEINAINTERERISQYETPLSEIEKKWLELDKKLSQYTKLGIEMPQDELDRYVRYGKLVRRSLLNHTHPLMAHRKTHES